MRGLLLRLFLLLSCMPTNCLASGSQDISSQSVECLEEPIDFISGLDWIVRFFQFKGQLSFELAPDCNRTLIDLDSCISAQGVKTVNKLFSHIMESAFKTDKTRALQALDPSLNDATATHLVSSLSNRINELPVLIESLSLKEHVKPVSASIDNFGNLSGSLKSLSIDGTRTIDKNRDGAKIILKNRYSFRGEMPDIDSSIWFILNQLEFFQESLSSKLAWITDFGLFHIIECKVVLRPDVNLELLIDTISKRPLKRNWIYYWLSYRVEQSPFKDNQLYGMQDCWELISELLLLEDPKLAAKLLGTSLPTGHKGSYSYLLLLQENPAKRLMRLKCKQIGKMYSCFILILKINLPPAGISSLCGIPREMLVELASHLTELQKCHLFDKLLGTQLEIPYLRLVSMLKDKGSTFNNDLIRSSIQNPHTLELSDVIGTVPIEEAFWGKGFNEYLLENPNWDKVIQKHFHYYISFTMTASLKNLTRQLSGYFGLEMDNHEIVSVFADCCTYCVDCTLSRIPRHLNSYLETIDKQFCENGIDPSKRLAGAITDSMFNDEAINISHRKDIVRYRQLESNVYRHFRHPTFINFVRLYYRNKCRYSSEIRAFLYFEHLMSSRFPALSRMDLEKSFQKLLIKDNLSGPLEKIITENFKSYLFPFVLTGLQSLEVAILKNSPSIATQIQIKKLPMKDLLKVIYEALADPSPDLNLALIKRLFNAQLLHVKSV